MSGIRLVIDEKDRKVGVLIEYDRVRRFLRRRSSKIHSRGTRQFSSERVFGPLGVHFLRRWEG
jgi:hypothetical protein